MRVVKGKLYAVVRGDLVGSTGREGASRRRLHASMRRGLAVLGKSMPDALPLEPAIFAGDSWEALLSEPRLALRLGLLFRAHLLADAEGADTRFVVAVGTVDFVPQGRLIEAEGEAFHAAARLLEQAGRRRMLFAAPGRPDSQVWDVLFRLIDELVATRWTAKRALAVSGALRGWKQDRIARLWKPAVSQPTVAGHLRGASWDAIAAALDAFEEAVWGKK